MVVPKINGEIRIIVHCKRLNGITVIPRVPHVRIDELLESLGEVKVFSTFGLQADFTQNAIHPGSIENTVLITSSGFIIGCEFRRVPVERQVLLSV